VRHRRVLGVLLAGGLLGLASCRGGEPLLSGVHTSGAALRVMGDNADATAIVHYTLSRPAAVSIWLAGGPDGQLLIRDRQSRPPGQDYQLTLDGTYSPASAALGDASGAREVVERRVVPAGPYRVTVQAVDEQGWREESVTDVTVVEADVDAPRIEDLIAQPDVISPNFDAIDDVAQISFRLTKDARVSIYATDALGRKAYVGVRDEKREAGAYAETWTGVVNERPLADGLYHYTVEARDRAGNVTVGRLPVQLDAGGLPKAKITWAHIAPRRILLGGIVDVEIGVRNIGDTVIRTQGPDPGYAYNSYESFGSIADGQFVDRAGFWRVGIDWQGAPITAGARFPYRWGFGHDLAPGEEVLVRGTIEMLHRVSKVWLYAGLVQEGHRYYDDGVGRAMVEVSF
jgi:hypothetical protein